MEKCIVSACLAGLKCRYDGESKTDLNIVEMVKNNLAIPVCPEQLGGLPTPRLPSEILNDKVFSISGEDVTLQFERGVEEAMKIVELTNCHLAYLKSKSPMCGLNNIYNGKFNGTLTNGDGYFARELKKKGVKICSI